MKINPAQLHFIGWRIRPSYVNQLLIDSIREEGQRVPIRVRPKGKSYVFNDGMCRVATCIILGIDVECILIDNDQLL